MKTQIGSHYEVKLEMNQSKGKIVSIQALRALAFFGIFLSHAGATSFKWPALGVAIFFVLSGYLMFMQYEARDIGCSIKDNTKFSWNKIKKLYPLHIITMVLAIVLSLVRIIHGGFTAQDIFSLLGGIVLNITLLQTWFPNSTVNFSLNGVAWYLSVTMFLYFMFPYIRKWIKNKKNSYLAFGCVAILILEIIVCIPLVVVLGNDSPVYVWFMYCFPVFRMGDFFIGCCLSKRYIEAEKNESKTWQNSIYEIVATIFTIMVFIWKEREFENPILLATQNWTTVYLLLAMMWVPLFVEKKGFITRLFTNRVTIFIGNISAYTFLIHYVITQYLNLTIGFLHVDLSCLQNILKIIIEFMLTIIATMIYMKVTKKKIQF